MLKHKLAVAAAFALLGLATASFGEICTLDPRPGATLLLPYFEVEPTLKPDPPPIDTIFTVVNASQRGVLVQVVIWSELGKPVYGFPLYLGGYDEQSVDLWAVVMDGSYPETTLSTLAQSRFPSCPQKLTDPLTPRPSLSAAKDIVSHLQGNTGFARRSSLVRGYVTLDVIRDCTPYIPGDLPYFGNGGTGAATNDNVLWGNFFYLDWRQVGSFNQGGRLVSLEADGDDPRVTPGSANAYTFYRRYPNAPFDLSEDDNREPLATNHAVQYFAGAGFEAELVYWRDPFSVESQADPKTGLPSWAPLSQVEITVLNEDRWATSLPQSGVNPFPVVSGKAAIVPLGRTKPALSTAMDTLPVPYDFGWIHLNLNLPRINAPTPRRSQSWVGVLYRVRGPFGNMSGLLEAVDLDSACSADFGPFQVPSLPSRKRPGGG